MILIVPNSLRDAIYAKLDDELSQFPDAITDREYIYSMLLDYFNEHGVIPDFKITKKAS